MAPIISGKRMAQAASMNGIDRQRFLSVLMVLAIMLFVGSGQARERRWRQALRMAAVACFALGVAAVLVEIGLWLGW